MTTGYLQNKGYLQTIGCSLTMESLATRDLLVIGEHSMVIEEQSVLTRIGAVEILQDYVPRHPC